MKKRKEWAHCYRRSLQVIGNHMHNYAETRIKFFNDMVYSCVKAYAIVQSFTS